MVRRNQQVTGGEEGMRLPVDQVPDWLVGVVNTRNLYWLTLAVLVVVYLVVLWVDRSRLGHLAEASRENELRVRVLGLRPYAAKLIVFTVAAACATLAGVAYMLLQSGTQPSAVGADLTITVLVMVVLGGVGFRWGAIVGGVLYTILDQRLTVLARSEWIHDLPDVLRIPLSEPLFLLGVLFILVVMFLPGGIAGTIDAQIRRRRGERTRSQLTRLDDAADAPAEQAEVRA
jgi:branched-chain amino acid transport system permease protein